MDQKKLRMIRDDKRRNHKFLRNSKRNGNGRVRKENTHTHCKLLRSFVAGF